MTFDDIVFWGSFELKKKIIYSSVSFARITRQLEQTLIVVVRLAL